MSATGADLAPFAGVAEQSVLCGACRAIAPASQWRFSYVIEGRLVPTGPSNWDRATCPACGEMCFWYGDGGPSATVGSWLNLTRERRELLADARGNDVR